MKALHNIIWLLIIVILQPILISSLRVFGVAADLFLCFAALNGFHSGRVQGAVWGMIFGLALDICVGRFVGANMIALALAGYLAAVFSDRFYGEPPFYVLMSMGAVEAVICSLVYLVPYSVAGDGIAPLAALRIFLVGAALNAVLILPVEWCFKRTLGLMKIQNTKNFR